MQSIKYQEIPPYITAVIQAKLKNTMQFEKENYYIIKAHSDIIDNNPNLRCYPTLLYNDILCDNNAILSI